MTLPTEKLLGEGIDRMLSGAKRNLSSSGLLLFVQLSPTLKYLRIQIQALVGQMVQVDETDLIYKGPWVRNFMKARSRFMLPLHQNLLEKDSL